MCRESAAETILTSSEVKGEKSWDIARLPKRDLLEGRSTGKPYLVQSETEELFDPQMSIQFSHRTSQNLSFMAK
jgi:hypothetical protein